MVFESIVADVLNRILGDYVENLDSKQLSIGIWGGDVVLENLVLKQSALEELDLPIQTVYGRLGKLVLKIPWKNLYGAPVEAIIEGLYLLVVPNLDTKYDPIKEEKYEFESKQNELKRIEEAKKKEAERNKPKVDDTFVEKLTTQIIKNVQVKVQDIHIRYEDKITNKTKPFSCGITLSNISVETTDESWTPGIITDALSKIFKVLSLDGLAVYWNCNSELYYNLSHEQITAKFKQGIATRDIIPEDYLYIFGPIWSSARLRMNPKPEKDTPEYSSPKVVLNLEMEKLSLGISKTQYQDIMLMGESMDRMNKGLPYRKYRVNVPVKGNARDWWQFAYKCVLVDVRRKHQNWDWLHILDHRESCREYAKFYQDKLKSKKISSELKQKLDDYEKKLDVFNLIIIRQRIELEVERIAKKTEELSKGKSWFSGWWGRAATEEDQELQSTTDIMKKFEEAMTPDEKNKLYRAIDYQENSAPAEYPEDYITLTCAFLLHSLEIEVRDDTFVIPRVLSTELKGVNCRLQQRPAANALHVAVKIDEFTVYGLQQNGVIPQFVSSLGSSAGVPLLDVIFETNPNKNCGQRLHIKSQPLRIIYDAQTIIKIVDIFQTPPELVTQLQTVAGNKLNDFNEMTASGMQYAIDQHSHLDLDIDFSAPYIILPYGGFYSGSEAIIVVNLGQVKITSVERTENYSVRALYNKGTSEGEILHTVMSQSYDKFSCELSNVQILLARPDEDWQTVVNLSDISPMHILQPMSINVLIQKCLVCDDPRLPKMKIDGELPSIMLNLSDETFLMILDLCTSVPFPKSEEPEIPLKKTDSRGSHMSLFLNIDEKLKRTKANQTSEGDTFVQSTDINLKFAMKQFMLVLSKKSTCDTNFKRLLKFNILNLELDLVQQTYNVCVDLRLGGIGLKQYYGSSYHDVVSTPMTDGEREYLLSITYQQVNRRSPEFYTRYHSCEQSVVLVFTSLNVQLHQEGLQRLLALATEFQVKLDAILNKEDADRVGYTSKHPVLAVITEEVGLSAKNTVTSFGKQRKGRRKVIIETITFKLTAKLKEFNVLLKSEARDIASAAIKGINANVVVKETYTQIDANLADLVVLDLDPSTKHKEIICVAGNDNAIASQVVMFNIDDRNVTQVNMSVQLRMGRLRILFLNSFVTSLLRFLNNFQTAQQAIIDAAAEAAEVAKQNVTNIYQNATRIDLDVKMIAPNIIIPANTRSLNAIVLDLGYLTFKNKFLSLEVENEIGQPAIVDDLNLTLDDLKLMRVQLAEDYSHIYECVILKPISFALWIKRNLSTAWYNSIPDIDIIGEMKAIELNLNQCDYMMMMQVLNENLTEMPPGEDTFGDADLNTVVMDPSIDTLTSSKKKSVSSDVLEDVKVHTFLKYTLTVESLIINLYNKPEGGKLSENPHSSANGLATFSLDIISLKGRIFSDNTIVTSLLLVDCLLDDTRPGREGKLTRMMERTEELPEDHNLIAKHLNTNDMLRSMFDITFQQKKNETFVDVRIFSFNLILSIDYLLKIGAFFTEYESLGPQPKPKPKTPKPNVSRSTVRSREEPKASSIILNLRIEKPDIILVEKMDNIDVHALILNTEMTVSVKMSGEQKTIRGNINDLQLYTCCYNPAKRKDTKSSVLRPSNITVIGTPPEEGGLNLEVLVTPIKISISPPTIDLLNRIMVTLTTSDDSVQNVQNETISYSQLWDQKLFNDSDYWFLKTELGEEVQESTIDIQTITSVGKEYCLISAPQVILTMEAGLGTDTLPLLLLESCFDAQIHNWSSDLSIESSLSVQMGYYNNELAIWEPLIEPVESIGPDNVVKTIPWSLQVKVQMNNPILDTVESSLSPDEEEPKIQPSKMVVDVQSKATLELVVTKTCMEVLNNLLKSFQAAVKEGVPTREILISPYKVINDTGLKLTLKLQDSDFEFFSKHGVIHDYKDIVLESGAEVPLQLSNVQSTNDLNLELGLGLSSTYMLKAIEEKNLIVDVEDLKCALKLPIVRADKRYFPLNYRGESNDNWGIVSDITVQGAQTIVTLRSMLKIYNHFHRPIDVYYMTNRGNELEFIKKVDGGESMNIPLNAVYTLTNELFFSVENHSVTAVPYVWKDLQLNLTVTKILNCPPINEDISGPFIMKVRGEMEQIFYENTNRHTMSSLCYNIHIRPTITFRNYLPYPVTCIVQGDLKETVVEPGELMHMPTVHPGESYIVLKLINYLEKDWTCKRDVHNEIPEFSVLQFDSHDSIAKMTLDLGLHCVDRYGTTLISLYCPFWMLNKTGLMLSYRNSDDNLNVMHHPANFKGPILFSFNAKNFFGKKKASIRVDNGDWSDKFSIDVAGSSGMVVCRTKDKIYQVGVHNQLTYNSLTKQITFTPYFVLINLAPYAIECQELERPADPWIKVEADSCTPFWPKGENDDKLLKIRVVEMPQQIAPPFFITEVHNTLLKLPNKCGGVNVDVQIAEGAVYITFTPYTPGSAPGLIVNHTGKTLSFWEKESVVIRNIPPKHTQLFTWENPTSPRLLLWESGKKSETEDDLRKDGLGEFPVDNERVFWVSFLDGMQRVLLFTTDISIAQDAQSSSEFEHIDQEINISFHGLGLSVINNTTQQEVLYLAIASTGVVWETCKLNSKRFKQLSYNDCNLIEAAYQQFRTTDQSASSTVVVVDHKTEVDFVKALMFKPHKRKLRRSFQTGLWVQMKTSSNQLQLHAKINRIQVDNQMYDCVFPVVLAPVPPPKSIATESVQKPFIEISIVQRVMKHSRVQQFKYFKVLIQEFHIKVDLGFVNAVLGVLAPEQRTIKEDQMLFVKDMDLVNEPLLSHVSTQSLQEQKNFYDLLHFCPLKIHISFSMQSQGAPGITNSAVPEFLNVLLQGLGVTLTDMQDVVFRLAFFEREYTFLTQRQLTDEATSHYIDQAVKQLYVLVLGLDVIGNPYGLVLGLTKGVEDLFYEPFQGAIQGPGEFAEGLVLGVRSLFGHTVGGAAGAVSRITGAMGKGVAVLTFDKDYQRKRRDQINKKPANLQEGLARSGKGLVMGVVDGVTGVFTKPISGAKEQGVEGFFKGLGKGAVGLVTRPTAGVIDFASGSLDAVKRAAEIGDEVIRIRPPRFMHTDGLVRAYNKQEAEGNRLLVELEKGKYSTTDTYAFHKWIIFGKDILLLTDKRLAYVVRNEIFGGWQIEWSYTWQDIQVPPKVVDRGVLIVSGEPKKKVLGLFGSGETGKLIIITDPQEREKVKTKIEELRLR